MKHNQSQEWLSITCVDIKVLASPSSSAPNSVGSLGQVIAPH